MFYRLTIALIITLAFSAQFTHDVWAFPLRQIQTQIQATVQSGRRPIAIFDLDETLIHAAKRKVLSYRAAIERNPSIFVSQYPVESRALLSRSVAEAHRLMMDLSNQYDSKAWLNRMGIQSEAFRKTLDQWMMPIYLSSEFMLLDRAYHGASGLVNRFYRAGGDVYFVSSRYRTHQYEATLQRLILSSLFFNARQSQVILREDNESSLDFKMRAFQLIKNASQNTGKVVLVGENEPENLNAMIRTFPEAIPVFVVGAILNTQTSLLTPPGLIKTKTFLEGVE